MLCADQIGLLAGWLSKEEKDFILWVTHFLVGNRTVVDQVGTHMCDGPLIFCNRTNTHHYTRCLQVQVKL